MSKPNYRVVLSFDSGRKVFIARAPELDPCSAEGPTRKEAIDHLEEEIDAQLANMLAHGSTPPRSVDEDEFTGEVTLKISKSLHKELAYTARHEGIDTQQLVSELVAAALADRRPKGRNPQAQQGERNGNRGYGNRGNNMALLDDRANFIEYVRGLDSGSGNGNGNPGNGGPRHAGGGHNRGGHGGGPGGGPGGQNRGGRGGRNNNHRGGRPGGGPGGGGGRPQHGGGQHGGPQQSAHSGPPVSGRLGHDPDET